jgi:hypothetical protein
MSNYDELISKLRASIETELTLCDPVDTPYVCRMLSDRHDKEQLVKAIVRLVEGGYTISRAIVKIEHEFNPNREID